MSNHIFQGKGKDLAPGNFYFYFSTMSPCTNQVLEQKFIFPKAKKSIFEEKMNKHIYIPCSLMFGKQVPFVF